MGHSDKKMLPGQIWRYFAFGILLSALGGASGNAQALYGSIVGNVTDKSAAAIPGATVKIINKGTNQVRESITNSEGSFNFPTVQTGTYVISVSKNGFKTLTRSSVEVTLNNITRTNLALEIGEVSETISVTADAPLLQADRAEVRSELTSRKLLNLPIPLGRNYQQLFRSLPGITRRKTRTQCPPIPRGR